MNPGENVSYFNLLLFDKGLKTQTELETAAAASELDKATIGYGLACWLLVGGEKEKAFEMFSRMADLPYWPVLRLNCCRGRAFPGQGYRKIISDMNRSAAAFPA